MMLRSFIAKTTLAASFTITTRKLTPYIINKGRPGFATTKTLDALGRKSAASYASVTAADNFVEQPQPQPTQQTSPSSTSTSSTALSLLGTSQMDVRRFDMLVHAGPMDFRGLVHEVPNDQLDWNTTIFHTITDPHLTQRLKARFGQRPLWADSVIQAACHKATRLPPQQYFVPPKILEFVQHHCEFKNEHADGGFRDHLDWCAEYTARYFPEGSPTVLFLHSICGVNTNLFPLPFDKIPLLKPLLTDHDYVHMQAFPCMLRLLFVELIDVLWDEPPDLADRLQGITIQTFHGITLTLEGDEFWMHLNYHLIHILDFLPTQHYDQLAVKDGFTRLFIRLHQLLRTHHKLMATVQLDRLAQVAGMKSDDEDLPTWEFLASKADPQETDHTHAQLGLQMRHYSHAINHDLSYQLHWRS